VGFLCAIFKKHEANNRATNGTLGERQLYIRNPRFKLNNTVILVCLALAVIAIGSVNISPAHATGNSITIGIYSSGTRYVDLSCTWNGGPWSWPDIQADGSSIYGPDIDSGTTYTLTWHAISANVRDGFNVGGAFS
jgi:hypothetical protein